MTKILSVVELAEKQRRNKRLGSIVLISLLVLSTLGFALSSVSNNDPATQKSGSYFNGQYWVYPGAGRDYYFSYGPSELDFTNIDFDMTLADVQGKILYLDNPESLASLIVESNLIGWSSRIQPACYGSCERDLPEKDCSEPIIVVRLSETESVSQQDSCIFISGSDKTVNAFLYRILGFN